MSRPAVLDLDALLAPIPGPAPAGADPRRDPSPASPYLRAKDARAGARAAERAAPDAGASLVERWAPVIAAGSELLVRHAKDVEVAAWMTEALVRTDGIAGLRDGLRLLSGLAERFWDGLHPMPDEDGLEARVAPVAGLNGAGGPGTLAQPIRTVRLAGAERALSLWDYERMLEAERLTDPGRKAARLAAGALSAGAFRAGVAATPPADLRATLATVEEAEEALRAMATAFAPAGPEAPPTDALTELLDRAAGAIRAFAVEALAPARDEPVAPQGAPPPPSAPPPAGPLDEALSREGALAAVLDLAAHFRRTEPQAPISYTLVEAVRRARMSLPDLLGELTLDAAEAGRVLLAAGIRHEIAVSPPAAPAPPLAAPPRAADAARTTPTPSDGW